MRKIPTSGHTDAQAWTYADIISFVIRRQGFGNIRTRSIEPLVSVIRTEGSAGNESLRKDREPRSEGRSKCCLTLKVPEEIAPLPNLTEFVETVRKVRGIKIERPFTLPELRSVLDLANDEWRSMILFGLYTGQRL
jgi:hypothetical protein